ncbi:unnamed protein product [Dicrocoelium dendriticum]|nr:unnamed protein product [Dicrocoelium dendriticum]
MNLYKYPRPPYLANSYGPFARPTREIDKNQRDSSFCMTGVGGRPELVLEAAPTEDGPWTEYHFRFKPGAIDRIPPIVAPHQPRLDWQMWFAALGHPDHHPWLYHLIYRLLQQEPDVLGLLDSSKLPRNPKFIRAKLYTYHYTSPTDRSGNWWRRVHKSIYLPPVSLSSPSLISVVQHSGLVGKRHQQSADSTRLSMALKSVRAYMGQPPDLTRLIVVCIVLSITKRVLLNASDAP